MDIKPLVQNIKVPQTTSEPPKLSKPTAKVDTSLLNKRALDPAPLEKIEQSVNQVTKQELEKVIDNLNRFFGVAGQPYLKFKIHDETDQLMVSIMDLETKRIVRELPPKEVLDMQARIQHFVGLLIDEKI